MPEAGKAQDVAAENEIEEEEDEDMKDQETKKLARQVF